VGTRAGMRTGLGFLWRLDPTPTGRPETKDTGAPLKTFATHRLHRIYDYSSFACPW